MKSDNNKEEFVSAIASITPEVLFVFLPLIVIAIVLSFKGNFVDVFYEAEWSFAAAVLSGQVIVRLVTAVSAKAGNIQVHNVAIFISSIIVLLLVPTLIVLVLMLTISPIPTALIVSQLVLFILSLFVFIIFGAVGNSIYEDAMRENIEREISKS